MIPRTLEKTIERAMRTFPAVLITGPRQSGKTTLLRERFSGSHGFISLENPDVRERVIDDPIGFLKHHPPPIILDEIQYTPELLHYIKSAIDEDRSPGAWLLSGSQNFALMKGVSQSLSGRVAVLSLLPFSMLESRGQAQAAPDMDHAIHMLITGDKCGPSRSPASDISLDDWLLRGGYPEIRSKPDVDRKLWCSGYVQTYLERDVRQIINIGDLNTFNRFIRLCAARTGQILNMSEISRDAGVSVPTIKKWLSVLEASYQIYLLSPHFKNFGKRIIKSPKIYFLDVGIATFLLRLHGKEPLMEGPMLGRLFETMVVAEWVKAFYGRGEQPELYFWRTGQGLEIDLLVNRNARLYPMEIKSTSTIRPHHAKSLEQWQAMAGGIAETGLIVADVEQAIMLKAARVATWGELSRVL